MITSLRLFILLFLFVLSSTGAKAFHIVGGELFYDCLGGQQYRITLKLYRDCAAQGANVAPFGNPEHIAVFDKSKKLVTQIPIPFPGSDTLDDHFNNNCIIIPPGICVEEAVYSKTVTLPSSTGGYHLVYQRCCRNHTISNVSNPGQAGSTYSAEIPEVPFACNNSPRFDNFPPVFICVNQQLNFDHSATDPDGDSLVYEVCDPFLGASKQCPLPSPLSNQNGCPTQPSAPPYSPIPWGPGFSASNPLGGNTFNLDQQTGKLTVTPPTQGQFVVGICVKEYRNGKLIGRTKRDFQFNVVNCQAPFAGIPTQGKDPQTGIGIYSISCNDFNVSFQNSSSNAVKYHWNFGDPTTQQDTSTTFEPSYSYPDTGSYVVTLVAEHQRGCTDTTKAVVKVFPFFQADFSHTGLCQNESISFSDQTRSTHGNVNSWNWDFGDGTNSNTANPSHTYSSPGIYNVHLTTTSDKGCFHDTIKTVRVFPQPSAVYSHNTTCIGDSTFFNNLSSGQGDPITQIHWDLGDGTTANTENPSHLYNASGTYPVTLSTVTSHGCADTLTTNVTVHELPTIQINQDTTICKGTAANLRATGGTQYNWSPGKFVNDSTLAQPTAIIDSQTTFSVTVTDTHGCVNQSSTTVSVIPAPTVTTSEDTSICLGTSNSAQLNASGAPSYQWNPSAGLNCSNCQSPVASPSDTTIYVVQGSLPNGCTDTDSVRVDVLNPSVNPVVPDSATMCTGDTLNISAFGGDNYQWSPAAGLSSPNVQRPEFFPGTTTTYFVTVSNYCFSKSDSLTVVVKQSPPADAGNDRSMCLGDTIQISGAGGTNQFWTPGTALADSTQATTMAFPDTTTSYVLTTVSPNGCESHDTIQIDVAPPPNAQAEGDTTICRGDPATLGASGGSQYLWTPNRSLSCTSCSTPVAQPSDTTVYRVRVSAIPGCERYDSVQVNVKQPVTANIVGTKQICRGESVQLQGLGGLAYQWTPQPGDGQDSLKNITVVPDSSMTYRLIASNGCPGFADTTTFSLMVRQLPSVEAGEDVKIFRERATTLQASGGQNYEWKPANSLETPLRQETRANPFQTTTYAVSAENRYGCEATDSVTVVVEGKDILAVPTAFSPNGDGSNEEFHILEHLNIKKIKKFAIYNRWGEKVFDGKDVNDGWDGTYKGKKQNSGTYIYVIKAVNHDGETISKSGNLTLVR